MADARAYFDQGVFVVFGVWLRQGLFFVSEAGFLFLLFRGLAQAGFGV
jgi:hypothetical protein